MLELLAGFILTITSLLIGFSLGRHQAMIAPDTQRKIQAIFKRVVSKRDVGPIVRPSAEDNYYRDHPTQRAEDEAMGDTLEKLR